MAGCRKDGMIGHNWSTCPTEGWYCRLCGKDYESESAFALHIDDCPDTTD